MSWRATDTAGMTLNTIEKPFKWGAAGDVLLLLTNQGERPIHVHWLVIQNGGTAGTTTPAAVDVKTPSSEYVVTMASGTMPVGMAAETVFLGAEPVEPGQTFLVTMKTATTAAIDGKISLGIQA